MMLVLALSVPAFADNGGPSSAVHLFIDSMAGEWEDDASGDKGDTEAGFFGIAFRHYFTPLETTDAPYAMRGFLQHPSTIEADYVSFSYERDMEGSPIKAEAEGSELSLGGMYFAGKIGFGAEVTLGKQDLKIDAMGYKRNDESTGLALKGAIYANETTRLDLTLENIREETDDPDSTFNREVTVDQMIRFGVGTFINNNMFLSAELGLGRREHKDFDTNVVDKYDTSTLEVLFGYYLSQNLGLLAGLKSMAYENTDYFVVDEGSESTLTLGVEYYPTETAYVGAALISMTETEKNATTDEETTGLALRLEGGFLF
jgi:hypothetical protein